MFPQKLTRGIQFLHGHGQDNTATDLPTKVGKRSQEGGQRGRRDRQEHFGNIRCSLFRAVSNKITNTYLC